MRRSACQGILVLFMSCLLVTTSTAEPSATRSPDLGDSFQRDYLTTAARPLFPQLWDDLSYIVNEPDFYYIIGGVALGPTLADEGFDHEEPRFTNLWGRSRFADNLFELGEAFDRSTERHHKPHSPGRHRLLVSLGTHILFLCNGGSNLFPFR